MSFRPARRPPLPKPFDPRPALLAAWQSAATTWHPRAATQRALEDEDIPFPTIAGVIAVGKMARGMMHAALDEPRLAAVPKLCIAPTGDGPDLPGVTLIEAAHPLPDDRSLAAAQAAFALAARIPTGHHLLVLLSGGASALMEAPRPPLRLEQVRELHAFLLAAGWPIAAINAVRAGASAIKGGGLAARLPPGAGCVTLAISDVPGDDPAVIGSAPSVDTNPQGPRSYQVIVPRSTFALALAMSLRHRYPTDHFGTTGPIADGPVAEVSQRLAALAAGPRVSGKNTWLVTHGEPWVRGGDPTQGGRATHLAALAAEWLRKYPGAWFAAMATDGADGQCGFAGAAIHSGTWEAVARRGDPLALVRELRAAEFHRLSGTGLEGTPTGMNYADVQVLYMPRSRS